MSRLTDAIQTNTTIAADPEAAMRAAELAIVDHDLVRGSDGSLWRRCPECVSFAVARGLPYEQAVKLNHPTLSMAHVKPEHRGVMGLCPLCGDRVQDRGFFWEGSEFVHRQRPNWSLVVHPGCLHPWVIVVTEPLDGSTTEGVHVGQLHGAPDGLDGWWLVLEPIVVSSKQAVRAYSVSIPWDRVRRIELRYDQ